MLAQEIIRAAIPNASEELCEHIIWERTTYPINRVSAKALYKAASRLKRAHENGVLLCEFCDNKITTKGWCIKCETSINLLTRRATK